MSFRGRNDTGNPNKMELGEPRKFGPDSGEPRKFGPDSEKSQRDEGGDRFDSGRGRRPPYGRGGRPSPGREKPFPERPREYGFERDDPMMRDRSPLRRPEDRFQDRFRKEESFPKREELGRKETGRPYFDDGPRDRFMDNRSRHEGPPFNSRFDTMSPSLKPRPMNYPSSASKGFYNEGFPRPNECEIIVVNKQQRAYAESVEERVKSLGILVDILFLKDEALLTQTIDDIARRGSLYAMVISPQNETHNSVTVNILHGTPQEHRNMPLDDALKLLSRNFHEHIRAQREQMDRERAERGPYMGVVSADREIQLLLRMLADGRWISLPEINLVIRYLCERRDKMQLEGDEKGIGRMPGPPPDMKMEPPFKPKEEVDVAQKEQDLQNRIINLMNQGAPPSSPSGSNIPGLGMHTDANRPPSRQNQPSMSPNIPVQTTGAKSGRPGMDDITPGSQGLDSNLPSNDSIKKTPFSPGAPNASLTPDATSPTYINFDNPSVKKALDNLMQSGPNLLKNISLSVSGTSTMSATPNPSDTSAPIDHMMQRGNMGPPRNADMGGNLPLRNSGSLDMNPPRSGMGMADSGMSRNSSMMNRDGGEMMNRGYPMGGDMNPRNFGNMPDMGRMGPGLRGNMGQELGHLQNMNQGGNFPNQFNKFQGSGGNFPGPYNQGMNMGNMRQNYGGPQGMGGMGSGPRRY